MRIGIFFIYIKVLLVATILTSCFLAKEIKVVFDFHLLIVTHHIKIIFELFLPPNQGFFGLVSPI
jgi:hypothetical protein